MNRIAGAVLAGCLAALACSCSGGGVDQAAAPTPRPAAGSDAGSTPASPRDAARRGVMRDLPARSVPQSEGDEGPSAAEIARMPMAQSAARGTIPLEACSIHEGKAYDDCLARNAARTRPEQH